MFPYKELQQSLLHLMLPCPKCPNKSLFIKVIKKKKKNPQTPPLSPLTSTTLKCSKKLDKHDPMLIIPTHEHMFFYASAYFHGFESIRD